MTVWLALLIVFAVVGIVSLTVDWIAYKETEENQ